MPDVKVSKSENKSISLTKKQWSVADRLAALYQIKRSELFRNLLMEHLRETNQQDLLLVGDQQEIVTA